MIIYPWCVILWTRKENSPGRFGYEVLYICSCKQMDKIIGGWKSFYISLEDTANVYILAEGEEIEKPDYDYEQVNGEIAKLDYKVRKIRHAINIFNATTVLEGLNITIDEALVMMAQLNNRKNKLDCMRRRLPKERVNPMVSRAKSYVEYEYANYDINKVKVDYQQISEEITKIQLALDMCNQTKTFEINIE